jgi:tetratricopeptide (TPR) repeat protein
MVRHKIYAPRAPTSPELLQLGDMAMALGHTPAAIDAFEQARAQQGGAFRNDLELGVLYLSARRLDEARAALDRVPRSDPGYPMALFKRAQVSVLLNEPDQAARIRLARQKANAATRALIEREQIFRKGRR